jgi:RNA polymerase sigma-70 factor (ECF subfamily)
MPVKWTVLISDENIPRIKPRRRKRTKFFAKIGWFFTGKSGMSQTMTSQTEDFIPTRYSLLSRLQNRDDKDSWKDFFDTYWRLIYSIALRSGLTEDEAQDVVQETIICVAKDIDKFKRDRMFGSFKGWLRNLTRWRITDQLRKRKPRAAGKNVSPAEENTRLPETSEIPDPADDGLEKIWDEEWQTNLMDAALERVKRRVKEEHYQMFDLNVIRQWPANKVAKTLEVSVAQVYLAKYRILMLIKREVRLLEKQWDGSK